MRERRGILGSPTGTARPKVQFLQDVLKIKL
jgi:hypothetical protein